MQRSSAGAVADGAVVRPSHLLAVPCSFLRFHSATTFLAVSLDDFCSDAKSLPRIRDDQRASDLVLRCERRATSF